MPFVRLHTLFLVVLSIFPGCLQVSLTHNRSAAAAHLTFLPTAISTVCAVMTMFPSGTHLPLPQPAAAPVVHLKLHPHPEDTAHPTLFPPISHVDVSFTLHPWAKEDINTATVPSRLVVYSWTPLGLWQPVQATLVEFVESIARVSVELTPPSYSGDYLDFPAETVGGYADDTARAHFWLTACVEEAVIYQGAEYNVLFFIVVLLLLGVCGVLFGTWVDNRSDNSTIEKV